MKRIFSLAMWIGITAGAALMAGCGEKTAEQASQDAPSVATPPAPASAAPADANVQPSEVLAQLPEGHPVVEGLTDKKAPGAGHTALPRNEPQVVVPESVKKRWKAVTLEVSGAGMKQRQVRVTPGQNLSLGRDGLSLTIGAFLPSYMSDFSQVSSDGDELKNPALQVTVSRDGKALEKGWLFRDYPQFNTLSNGTVTLRLVAAHE